MLLLMTRTFLNSCILLTLNNIQSIENDISYNTIYVTPHDRCLFYCCRLTIVND